MQLVEQHRIDRHDPRWQAIDEATFASKNLYNAALYVKRQAYIHEGNRIISQSDLDKVMQPTAEYRALPAKVAQWVLNQVCAAWDSYFAACAEWKKHPDKFLGHPKLPTYLDKHGRNLLVYTVQAISRAPKNAGWIVPSQVPIRIKTSIEHAAIAQVRLVPHATHYTVEVVYARDIAPADVNPDWVAGIDLGVNNLVTIAANQPGFVPLLINGRPLKALNQWYNKRRAHLQSKLPKGQFSSRQLDIITAKRKRQIDHYLHVASRQIIDVLVAHRIGTLAIGKNAGWKQKANMGKRTNQSFVFLPHARLIEMLTYKAQLVGMTVITTEESHTSKCSFLDNEAIGHHDQYAGKRVKRGLFRTATGKQFNADVNGAYNMIVKVVPNAFSNGRAGVVVHPVELALQNRVA